ncbi:hypothetical protein BU24DRAFT_413208 [Aaosphaeria arxii CBS 175.79]|uniref:DUF7730 domain-containing protein n=1 Tax=Aaosphaeria arxii CBS 175.79 TaxID=1450172 RepID=A0A6A5XF61_9PLEO|nr:uncharacterized protein BU24DRAFT_413208 [Aaosphaeria arxii CBS 175.79]KAF2011573.1 hypothetical protein BU24DRAFT_413208 [Aaosphaeria arxii CBS 175.79]
MNSFTSKSKPKTDDQTHRTLPNLLSKVNPVGKLLQGKKLWKRDHEGNGGYTTKQPVIEARDSLERAFKLDVQSLDRGRHLTDTSKWNYSTDIGVEAATGEGKPSNFSQQPLSPLFSRLPTEIREVIWDLVLCSNERIDFFLRKTESGSIDLRGMACKDPENGSPYHKCTREERTESSQVAFNAVLRCCKLAFVLPLRR